MFEYTLDPRAAKKADQIGGRIEDSGKYIGTFTRAEPITSKNTATQGVEFDFKTEAGQTATFALYTHKSDGTQLFGFDAMSALMTVMQLRSIRAVDGEVEKYDFDTKKREKVRTKVFPDMMNKSVGIVLQKRIYTKTDGGDGFSFNLYNAFNAETEQTATEVLEKTGPEMLGKIIAGLKDKDERGKSTGSNGNTNAASMRAQAPNDFEDGMIPF